MCGVLPAPGPPSGTPPFLRLSRCSPEGAPQPSLGHSPPCPEWDGPALSGGCPAPVVHTGRAQKHCVLRSGARGRARAPQTQAPRVLSDPKGPGGQDEEGQESPQSERPVANGRLLPPALPQGGHHSQAPRGAERAGETHPGPGVTGGPQTHLQTSALPGLSTRGGAWGSVSSVPHPSLETGALPGGAAQSPPTAHSAHRWTRTLPVPGSRGPGRRGVAAGQDGCAVPRVLGLGLGSPTPLPWQVGYCTVLLSSMADRMALGGAYHSKCRGHAVMSLPLPGWGPPLPRSQGGADAPDQAH